MRVTSHAEAVPCSRCRATIIRGLTQPPGAYEVVTDPVPLTLVTETAALLKGKLTYDLVTGITGHAELIRRDQFRIKQRDWPVLATHRCPGPVPWTPRSPLKEIQDHEIPY